ncbi:MAG TPA: BTAD domain-containing putative transcriptional regulator [Ktedonobacteraceae bacterium]|nr:BTAD domain-containing putative transcriptional regulator [Ktedonobacteraceae bacterium]
MDILRAFPHPKGNQEVSEVVGVSTPACHTLLIQALECLRSERYMDGIALLRRTREQLLPAHTAIVPIIDAIVQGYSEYVQAQERLLAASRHFARIDSEQRAYLAPLEAFLSQQKGQDNASELASVRQEPCLSVNHDASARQQEKQEIVQLEAYRATASFSSQQNNLSGSLPPLYCMCFGRFQVLRGSEPLTLCQNRNGQAILRYLVVQTNHRATLDALMETFWPDDEPDVARRKLQVAVSTLRRSLNQGYDCDPGGGYILFKDQCYQLNPLVTIASDRDEFLQLYEQGRRSSGKAALLYYEQACLLYTDPCFVEDLYADWSCSYREQCTLAHSAMCTILAEDALSQENFDRAIVKAKLVLAENRCDETAYRLLMLAYAAQGRRSEAIRQYHRCVQVLREELAVAPMPETTQLFNSILLT